ncbi:RNA polymerase sigma factor [Pedobacter sp. R20-19]|uniref:RNA polymerase sigma factor n=1 Tax=Pedobacter sp. R20-19 TaxID=1270196 RepID=UPI000493479B|nr:sigma factor [Pedobacter sp. R20-19]
MQVLFNVVNQQETSYSLNIRLSDQEIFLNNLRAGDSEAFKSLYKQYAAAIYGIVRRKVTDEHTAELILEKIFIDVFTSIALYDEAKFKIFTWLHQIANRQISLHKF